MSYTSLELEILRDTKRRSRKEKKAFIKNLNDEGFYPIKEQYFDCGLINFLSCSIFRNCNLIFGDIEKAKYIVTAHYDTPIKSRKANKIFAYKKDTSKIKQFFQKKWFGLMTFSLLISIVYVIFAICYRSKVLEIASLGLIIYILFCFYKYFFHPISNPSNINDNTSGVLAAIKLYDNLKYNEDLAVVLFDNEEKNLRGSRCFKRKYKDILKDKTIINLDCVGDGEVMVFGYSDASLKPKIELAMQVANGASPQTTLVVEEQSALNGMSDHKSFEGNKVITVETYSVINDKKGNPKLQLTKIHTPNDTFENGTIDKKDYFSLIQLAVNFLTICIDYKGGE